MKYWISHQGEQVGPWTLEDIVHKVRAKELELFDFIMDPATEDWVLLMEFSELAAKLKSHKPPRPGKSQIETAPAAVESQLEVVKPAPLAKSETASAHNVSEWFLLKGDNRFGPFSFEDIVRMLQQKIVYSFDFVWHSGLDGWKRLAELPDFEPNSIRTLMNKKPGEVFVPRRFQRATHKTRVIIHDNLTVWRGESFEISQGGVGLTMPNAPVVPGQQVYIHLAAQGDIPAFNAICEVVSKKFVNDNSPVEYGLRFLSLAAEAQDELKKKVA